MNFESNSETIVYSEIATALREMIEVDQAMRERSRHEDFWDSTVDMTNTKKLKEIVQQIGWPAISNVGQEGAHNAWLLAQHADHDVEFQEHCLSLMKAIPRGDVELQNIAYLEDRVKINRGQNQLYGTQFDQINGHHIPLAIEDEAMVDERRAQMGMGPLTEQIKLMYDKYPLTNDTPTPP